MNLFLKYLVSYRRLFILVASLIFGLSISAQTTNISGIINDYTAVTAISCSSGGEIEVASTVSLSPGDQVLLIQMKGAIIDGSNTSSYGDVTDYGASGQYEVQEIQSISGNTIFFTYALENNYNTSGSVQLVRIPEYDTANINGVLTAQAWNGTTGGVLIFFANNVTLNANIDVTGLGFRGGVLSGNNGTNNRTNYFYSNTGEAGGKGEGITETIINQGYGRGALASGGGGGNAHNAGGGGGANYGAGGIGGYYQGNVNNNRGEGGKALTNQLTEARVYMGGGGGAGHQNNSVGGLGANGGGIVMIKANALTGNGFSLMAQGTNAVGLNGNDGEGGGGAGGSLLLDIVVSPTAVSLDVRGGAGGDSSTANHGVGGGGGGGLIYSSTALAGSVTSLATGGANGQTSNGSAQNSAPGTVGLVSSGLTLVQGATAINSVCDLDNDGYYDQVDLDDDNDGILDTDEDSCGGNVAVTGVASMSSESSGGKAERGNDGSTNGTYNAGSVAHTGSGSTNEWFEVDLGAVKSLTNIVVWNRTDCCSNRLANAYLMVSDTPFPNNTNLAAALANADFSTQFGNTTNVASINTTYTGIGRYIRVQKSGTNSGGNSLQIAELEAFAICDTDLDGIPDRQDTDSDNDGCSDANEYYESPQADGGDDQRYGLGAPSVDGFGRVLTASYSGNTTGVRSSSYNVYCNDADADGIADIDDLDDDNDGLLDSEERLDCTSNLVYSSGAASNGTIGTIGTYELQGSWLDHPDITIFGLTTDVINNSNNGGSNPQLIYNFDQFVSDIQLIMTDLDGNEEYNLRVYDQQGNLVDDIRPFITHQGTDISDVNEGGAAQSINFKGANNTSRSADAEIAAIRFDFPMAISRIEANRLGGTINGGVLFAITAACEASDWDLDGIPNHLDIDSDNDGCNDVNEAGFTDNDDNGQLGSSPVSIDGNGLVTSGSDGYTGTQAIVLDNTRVPPGCGTDPDVDGITNVADLDDDNDGLLDSDESDCSAAPIALGQSFSNNSSSLITVNTLFAFGGVDVDAVFELKGNTGWANGVSNEDYSGGGIAPDGQVLQTQPNNTDFTNGDVAEYTYSFSQPIYNLSFKLGGLDVNDRADIAAFNGTEHLPVHIARVDNSETGIAITGQSVFSTESAGNAPSNSVQINISGPVTSIVIKAGKQHGNLFQVTMQLYELQYCLAFDSDTDGISDDFDLDSDNDGIYDVIEAGGTDLDNDGVIGSGAITDTNSNGWSDIADNTNGGTVLPDTNTDGTGLPNRLDLDSDDDGCNDVLEGGFTDINGNGEVDGSGYNADGTVAGSDGYTGTSPNVTDNTVNVGCLDSDGDGIADSLDIDDDNDGIADTDEQDCTSASPGSLGMATVLDLGTAVTSVFSDYQGWWASSSSSINPVEPNLSHDLVAFEVGGTIFTTGILNSRLLDTDTNGTIDSMDTDGNGTADVAVEEMRWQAFLPSNTISNELTLDAAGNDGNLAIALGNTIVSDVSTDPLNPMLYQGKQGLDLGTGLANIGDTWYYDVAGIRISELNDGKPDILITQVAVPSAVFYKVTLYDSLGNPVGNAVRVSNTGGTVSPVVGRYRTDVYDINGTLFGGQQNNQKDIRLAAIELSEFGLNPSNIDSVALIELETSSTADTAFLAYNADAFYVCNDLDSDGDGIPNHLDLDSDNDGIYDVVESGNQALDTDGDGDIDSDDTGFDDIDQNGMDDTAQGTSPIDTDGDGVIDSVEVDADDDGCYDVIEAGFTDDNMDGEIDGSGYTTNGIVLGSGGYTSPADADANSTYDFQEAGLAPTITTQPTNQAICLGCNGTFSATSTDADTFQWQIFNGSDWDDLTNTAMYSGTSTASLNITQATNAENNNRYRLLVSSSTYSCVQLISDEVILTVRVTSVITNRQRTYRVKKN